ncbi:hypothetical protein [Tenacibaculum jejuense]|uniref:Uncharacterized protein n=1 Tax=Tenacibaculum jejuense TaxID=584609 RepID=A0A238U572_9FLAO|nr:hypothetical protein [Tenacibaculum jejuense]SNR14361.1 Protein of unknown function precursor [Tenacibaculum jejuense]
MRRGLFVIFVAVNFYISTAQSNYEIAKVYFSKAEKDMEKIDYQSAKINFDKGVSKIDSIQKAKVAEMGTLIYYELKAYAEARDFAKKYFQLSRSKSSETYKQMLELYVDIEEKLEKIEAQQKEKEQLKLMAEKEQKRIDSLKREWNVISDALSIKADTIFKFNAFGFAIFKKEDKYGLLNDRGKVLIKPNLYKKALTFEGVFLFLDKPRKATQIYCYKSKENEGFELPDIKSVSSMSLFFEAVLLPRGNQQLVAYPNNSSNTFIFDLVNESSLRIKNIEGQLKAMKKADIIDKYDEDENIVKIDKKWYKLGGHLGGDIYTLYDEETEKLKGYLFGSSKISENENRVLLAEDIGYLGSFYKNKIQAQKGKNTSWYNILGEKVSKMKDAKGTYTNDVVIEKKATGKYQLKKDGVVFLRDKKLQPLENYLKENK